MKSAFASLLLLACSVYDPRLVAECAGKQPPARPTSGVASDERTVTFALRDLVLNQTERWREIGFNIDGYCTSEQRPRGDCTPRGPIASDGVDGIDNQLGRSVFSLVLNVQPTLEPVTTLGLTQGRSNPALRVSRWNGTASDSLVAVEIFNVAAVVGGVASQPNITLRGGFAYIGNDRAPLPLWDGNDFAFVPESPELFVATTGDPNVARGAIRDDSAYVANGTLVARIPQGVQLTFPGVSFSLVIRLLDGLIAAHIDDAGTLSHVVIAGRWSLPDLLRTAANVGVCPQTSSYQFLEQTLQNNADVFSDTRNRGMNLPCDAVSVGLLFETGNSVRIANAFVAQPSIAMPCVVTDGALTDGGVLDADAMDGAREIGAADATTDPGRDAPITDGRSTQDGVVAQGSDADIT